MSLNAREVPTRNLWWNASKIILIKALMVCLGFEPGPDGFKGADEGCKVPMNPLSYPALPLNIRLLLARAREMKCMNGEAETVIV